MSKNLIYKEDQLNQVVDILNNLEFSSGKAIANSQRLVMVFQILNSPIGTEEESEEK